MKNLAVVILAAGKSTRMKSKTSKVLHKIAGKALIIYSIEAALSLKPKKVMLVLGKGQDAEFREVIGSYKNVEIVIQGGAKGTGHAVKCAESKLKNFGGKIFIMPGDVPLVFPDTLETFIKRAEESGAVCSIISTILSDPAAYGRIVRDSGGKFVAIREEKDASYEEKFIPEINTGFFFADSKWLFKMLREVKPVNAQKEYYLTDVIGLAVKGSESVAAQCFEPFEQFLGVNDRSDLASVDKIVRSYINAYWMGQGVTLIDPDSTYIDACVKIGNDSVIYPSAHLRGNTVIGKNCIIDTGAVIEDAEIFDNVRVNPYTVITGSTVKNEVVLGPFSRIRPGSVIDAGARVGNFVEIKKSHIKSGAKANHLSYIGDAVVGSKTNIGCGTITCNYDGKKKHKTIISDGVFVGSDVQFVAPVRVGKGAIIGAGSTVTKNVPAGALALSRVDQVNVKNWKGKNRG